MENKLELAELAKKLEPFILTTLERAGVSPTGVYAPSPHALNSLHHFGEITQSQASWAVPDTTQVIAGDGLTGGGALNTDVTLNLNVGTGLVVTGDQLVLDWTAAIPEFITPGDSSVTGSSQYAARSDHQHGHYGWGLPITILPDATQSEGVADSYARSDHSHAITASSPSTNLAYNTGNSEGSANWFARSDHLHNITNSNNPGASATILSTDSSGYLQLLGLGIGTSVSANNRIELASGSEIGQPTGPELRFDSNNQLLILLFNDSEKIRFFDEGGISISPTHGSSWADKPNVWYYVYGDATSIADPLNGYESHIYHNAATTQGHIRGYYALVRSGSNTSAVVTNLYGAYYQLQGYGGDITQATGLSIWVDSWNVDTTIGTARGVHVDINQSSGTVTTSYGILIEDLVGVTKYAIHTGVGTISLGDDIQFRQASAITTTSGDLTFYATGGDLLISASNTLSVDNWTSGTTGWGVSYAGVADFRSINTDELVTKAFISDTTFTLAGSILLTKSRAILSRDFTIPAISSSGTIYLEDLEGLPDTAVFVSGDTIRLRYIDRSGGGLVISDVWGTVTTYTDLSGGEQSWSFTTAADAGGAAGSDVFAGSIALDYGQTGSGSRGVIHMTVTDAAGSPYLDIQDWNTLTSGAPSDLTTHVRLGNLDGISGIGAEYGLWAGLTSYQYFLASDSSFEAHGLALSLYESINVTIYIDPANPSIRIGDNATSMSYTSQTGIWMGNDSSTYKMRIGDPTGVRMQWVGNALEFYNGSNIKTIDFVASGQAQISGQLTMPGTSSAISIGSTPPTSATVGTGIWIDRTGMYGLDASTQQAIFDATTGKITAGAGDVWMDEDGISVEALTTYGNINSYKFVDPSGYFLARFATNIISNTISSQIFVSSATSPSAVHTYLSLYATADAAGGYSGVFLSAVGNSASAEDASLSLTSHVTSGMAVIEGDADYYIFGKTAISGGGDVYVEGQLGVGASSGVGSGTQGRVQIGEDIRVAGGIVAGNGSFSSDPAAAQIWAYGDGNSTGFYAGTGKDVLWYRGGNNQWNTPDNVYADSHLYVGVGNPAGGYFRLAQVGGSTIGGEFYFDGTWARLNQNYAYNIYTPRYFRAEAGLVAGSGVGTTNDVNYRGNLIQWDGSTTRDVYATKYLTAEIASTNFFGTGKGDTTGNLRTISTEFSGVPSTAKGLFLSLTIKYSTTGAWVAIGASATYQFALVVYNQVTTIYATNSGFVPTNGSNQIYIKTSHASMEIWLRCTGYIV